MVILLGGLYPTLTYVMPDTVQLLGLGNPPLQTVVLQPWRIERW
jgi:hypothetical protein